jgi:5'-methylthioinosine phosphorylase
MIGIIGGTGLYELPGLTDLEPVWRETRFGEPSSALNFGQWQGQPVVFLARHGNPHQIPPHRVNYRANLLALHEVGVQRIIAINAVGGIHPLLGPACLAVPDQLIDYTFGREHTVYDGSIPLQHVDFTLPFSEPLRQALLGAAARAGVAVLAGGVYGVTQGPRLESAAEIRRCRNDGCDMVGMTAMPEAALARELGLAYAMLALSVNRAAGLGEGIITMDAIQGALTQGMGKVIAVLEAFLSDPDSAAQG